MPSVVNVVEQFAAYCSDCNWHGDVYNDAEHLAEEDSLEHNLTFHKAKTNG